ncbi:hypothetical protein COS78_03535 [Candidatus Shapirobacteria bacterium CG06_land_8_20_14_3_00_40_12]|uniref:Radical SAM core domain-containing protein n=2 Tax=Candidatus Shapironibacteriota TaxID=1752721 RepID=A0A2M7TTP4_9BACT|nr:MAG: hypothetical protein COS78_03535 [Candidatus Shapirobacteria bacterium CG06_land_8_20_14_3_00_40_12]PIZ60314.1 MAG: hypothetical protein COY20_01260 [Candidatus Shapirobacteria bacterium CG_4_10_14_0_2_um_filter_40_12]
MKSKILFLWPPELPYDLTLHYHYTDFGEIAAYFLNQPDRYEVDIFDGGVLAYLKKEYVSYLLKEYDYLVILTYIQNTHSAVRAAELCKKISPKTKIIAYGSSPYYVPQFFEKESFDGYVWDGDWELAIESFIKYHNGEITKENTKGICVDEGKIKNKGEWLDPAKWAFPPLDLLPLGDYDRVLSQKKTIKKFGDRQISVTVSRGCPFACPFCKASVMYGRQEKRRPVDQFIKYVEDNIDRFDVLQMFAPNFTLDQEWTKEFCQKVIDKKLKLDWRCTTRAQLITPELAEIMAKAGCKSIGIGVESLQDDIQKNIGKVLNTHQILDTFRTLKKVGIIPKGYIMLGLPGQTREDVYETIRMITEAGGEVRPSSYSPYQNLNRQSTLKEIAAMNRYTYDINAVKGLSPIEFLKIVFERDLEDHQHHYED